MEYIKIPIKTRQEGIVLAEYYFGEMILGVPWQQMPNGDLITSPYANDFPVVITAQPPTTAKAPDAP